MKNSLFPGVFLLLGYLAGTFALPGASATDCPDPTVLLQGVESVHLQIPASKLRLRYTYKNSFLTNELMLDVDFDAERRAFSYQPVAAVKGVEAVGYQAIFDGSQAIIYDEEQGVVDLCNLHQQTFVRLFDPRAIGLSSYYNWEDDVKGMLPYRTAKSVKLIGKETVGGNSAWHVRLSMSFPNDTPGTYTAIDYWIDGDHGFRVYRKDYNLVQTFSFYEKNDYPWLPTRVVSKDCGNQVQQWECEILEANSVVVFPPSRWTLAAMGLKQGTDVIDLRINRRVGFWNGERFVALHPTEQGRSLAQRLLTDIICGLLFLCPVLIMWRLKWRAGSRKGRPDPSALS